MNSTEIQNEVDSLPAEGGEVLIPVGVHRLEKPIRLPAGKSIRFVGHGAASELLAEYSSAPVVVIEGQNGGNRVFSKSIGQLKLSRAPEFLGSEDTDAVGLLIENVAYIIVHDIHLTHQECGIKIQGNSGNTTVRDCWFLQRIKEGIKIIGGANYTIERCFIEPERVGLYLDRCEAVWAKDCRIINGGGYEYGVVARGERHHTFNIIQCTLEGANKSAIFFEDGIDRSVIRDCWIGMNVGASGCGIKLEPSCTRINISRNRIGDQQGAAIELYRVQGVTIDDNIFDGNGLLGNDPVIYLANSSEVRIRRNRFEGGRAIAGLLIGKFGGASSSVLLHDDNDFEQFSATQIIEE